MSMAPVAAPPRPTSTRVKDQICSSLERLERVAAILEALAGPTPQPIKR